MNDKQSVHIQFESVQDNETLKQQLLGEWYVKGKAIYITYEEQTEMGVVRNILRYDAKELKIMRRGALNSEQIHRAHERLRGYYDNSYIKLETEAYTHKLVIKDQHNGVIVGLPSRLPFSLHWEYDLYSGDQSIGRFKLCLFLKEDIN